MVFYRHSFVGEDARNNLFLDFSNLGFYDEYDEPLKIAPPLENNTHPYTESDFPRLYWKNDKTHKFCLRSSYGTWYNGTYLRICYWMYPSYNPSFDRDNNYDNCSSSLGGILTSHNNTGANYSYPTFHSIFFIPLKDGGFLLNTQMQEGSGSYCRNIPHTMPLSIIGNKYSDYTRYIYGWSYGSEDRITNYHKLLIGVPSTTKSILSKYMYILAGTQWTDSDGGYVSYNNELYSGGTEANGVVKFYTDFQDGGPLYSNVIPFNQIQNRQNISGLKRRDITDFNPNVCIMTKLPYDNGFIDNVYIMTTAPFTKTHGLTNQGCFFSFAGRNFINVYDDLVLELPGY